MVARIGQTMGFRPGHTIDRGSEFAVSLAIRPKYTSDKPASVLVTRTLRLRRPRTSIKIIEPFGRDRHAHRSESVPDMGQIGGFVSGKIVSCGPKKICENFP
jgi:hypothetical protein